MRIGIHYRNAKVQSLYEALGGRQTSDSAGFDLITVQEVRFERQFEFQLVDLGIVLTPPAGHHSLLLPRSSTFKRWNLLQPNSMGLIDEDYSGPEDFWGFPALYLGNDPITIPQGTRLAQFTLMRTLPVTEVVPHTPHRDSRGGLGSTGA